MNLTYQFLSKEEFVPILKEHRPVLFAENNSVNLEELMSETELSKMKGLDAKYSTEYRIYLLVKDGEKIVGWSWGFQKSGTEFYMCNSAVYPEYRNKKVYSTMLLKVLEKAVEDGFQEITSKHHASNNAVLIPKLKAGFLISGTEINARFGLMVTLTYFPNKKIEHVFHQRVGFKK